MKKKSLSIIIIFVIFIIVGVILGLIFIKKEPSNNNIIESPKKDIKIDIKQEEILLENKGIVVSKFEINYNKNEKKWFTTMMFENKTDEDINLKEYYIKMYDGEDKLLYRETASHLGVIESREKRIFEIESPENVENTEYIVIEKE